MLAKSDVRKVGAYIRFWQCLWQGSTIRKRKQYEEFLSKVPILGKFFDAPLWIPYNKYIVLLQMMCAGLCFNIIFMRD